MEDIHDYERAVQIHPRVSEDIITELDLYLVREENRKTVELRDLAYGRIGGRALRLTAPTTVSSLA